MALGRGDVEGSQATAHIVDTAESWLTNDWGKDLNRLILDSVQAHPHLVSLDSDVDAPTSAEVLRRASERPRGGQVSIPPQRRRGLLDQDDPRR